MPFTSLVPPNMDVECEYSYVSSSSLQIASTTCSNPLNYYKGYGLDIIIIFSVAFLIKKIFC